MIGASSFAVDIGDPDSTRTVWAIVALLVVMGLGLVMLAFWLRRTTRPDPEFLAPLELMGERSWRRGDPVWQRRRLDEVRPEGAEPLRRSAAPPRLDESFDEGPTVAGFDDLHDDAHPDADADTDADHDHDHDGDGEVDGAGGRSHAAHETRDLEHDSAPDVDDDHDVDDAAATPTGGSDRPFLDSMPEHEIDPDELRRAMEALDAELQSNRDD